MPSSSNASALNASTQKTFDFIALQAAQLISNPFYILCKATVPIHCKGLPFAKRRLNIFFKDFKCSQPGRRFYHHHWRSDHSGINAIRQVTSANIGTFIFKNSSYRQPDKELVPACFQTSLVEAGLLQNVIQKHCLYGWQGLQDRQSAGVYESSGFSRILSFRKE